VTESSSKKLRLKRESAIDSASFGLAEKPIATVLVDTGVVHLNDPYDYLIPIHLSETAVPGSLIEVHFGSRVTQGYVLDRRDGETSALKFIDKVLSPLAIYVGETREVIERAAKRYACSVWDLITTALPARAISVEKRFSQHQEHGPEPAASLTREYSILQPGSSYVDQLIAILRESRKRGSVLVVVPDYSDLRRLSMVAERELGEEILVFDESLTKSERYRSYLRAREGEAQVFLGTRSSIFTPLPPGSTIIIYSENEPAMWEKRYPAWNVRDMALLRAKNHSVHFASHAPSLEILRLAHEGWLEERTNSNVDSWRPRFTFEDSARSPEEVIRTGLKRGPVLITVARKGYINSFSCNTCRNIAHCSCGARLRFQSAGKIQCPLCSLMYSDWKCDHCGGSVPRATARGGERISEELRIKFPNVAVSFAHSDHRMDSYLKPDGIVVSTNGTEPLGRYAAVLLMDGAILFSSVGLRDDEEAKRAWFSAAAMSDNQGEVYVSFPSAHPASQSLMRWSTEPLASVELTERNEAGLPPFFRIAVLAGPTKEIESIKSGFEESQLFSHISVSTASGTESLLHVRTSLARGTEFEDFFHTFQRVRSLKNLPKISLRIDPYEF